MSELLCPLCARPSRGVCVDCYIQDHPIAVRPQTYTECECGLAMFKGKRYGDREELLKDVAVKSIVAPSGMRIRVLGVSSEFQSGRLRLKAEVAGVYQDTNFKRTVEWDIGPQKVKCESCVKLNSGYYEAVLQVRDDIEVELDPGKVCKIESTRGGTDYYLVSLDYAREKMSQLVDKGYLAKTSSKLYGKKNGKDVFRMYYSLKKPDFLPGDILEHDGQIVRVRELGKQVKLTTLPLGRETSSTMHRLEDAPVLARKEDVKKAIITEIRPDGMQILDTEDTQTYDVPAKAGQKQGDEIEYVKIRQKVYLIPNASD